MNSSDLHPSFQTIPLYALAIAFLFFIIWNLKRKHAERKREWEENPPPPDEGLDNALLPKIPMILECCGEKDPAPLPESLLPLAPRVRAFLETWKSVDFWRDGEFAGDPEYDRGSLAVFEENPSFIILGGDGGEQTYYVRRDTSDECVYVIDLEVDFDYTKPRPYASDIGKWIVLRCQENIASENTTLKAFAGTK